MSRHTQNCYSSHATDWTNDLLEPNSTENQREMRWWLFAQKKWNVGMTDMSDEMRDSAVKYLWSSPEEMLWGRRNQQKNRKWKSGSMLWLCGWDGGFSHTIISRQKHCCEQHSWGIQRKVLINVTQSHPGRPLGRSNMSTWSFQNSFLNYSIF